MSEEWQRLDPRMLLVHPVRELVRFLPVVLGVAVVGPPGDGAVSEAVIVGVPVLLGLVRYLTTTFRVTAERVELRRGLLSRHLLSVPRDRVRTVDTVASPVQRVLGLVTVQVGSGSASQEAEDRLDLDGLPRARAAALRARLLAAAAPEAADAATSAARPGESLVLALDPRWARYAPLTSTGLTLAAGAAALGVQVLGQSGGWDVVATRLDRWDAPATIPLLLGGALTAALVLSLLAVGGYLVANHGLRLTRDADAWHLRRGLTTTRETSLDVDRVVGVALAEPPGLRLAGAARLHALVTGRRARGDATALVPPAPRDAAVATAAALLGDHAPLAAPLASHGPAAARRRWTRAMIPALAVTGALVAAALDLGAGSAGGRLLLVSAVLAPPVGALLAADRVAALGHALLPGHLVVRGGSLTRTTQVVARDAVIAVCTRDSWWQRRAGLTHLVAATSGGSQQVVALDVPQGVAVDLADRLLPGLVTELLAPPPHAGQHAGQRARLSAPAPPAG